MEPTWPALRLAAAIAGSVRIPAHFCGVFGLKPSFGVIPQRGYLDHVGGGTTDADINVFGPIARDADDLDLLLGVLAGPSPSGRPRGASDSPPPRRTTLAGLRIGVWLEDPGCPMDREVLAVLRAAAGRLAGARAKIEEAHPPVGFSHQVSVFSHLLLAAVSPSLPAEAAEAVSGSHRKWLQADQDRAALRQVWACWF